MKKISAKIVLSVVSLFLIIAIIASVTKEVNAAPAEGWRYEVTSSWGASGTLIRNVTAKNGASTMTFERNKNQQAGTVWTTYNSMITGQTTTPSHFIKFDSAGYVTFTTKGMWEADIQIYSISGYSNNTIKITEGSTNATIGGGRTGSNCGIAIATIRDGKPGLQKIQRLNNNEMYILEMIVWDEIPQGGTPEEEAEFAISNIGTVGYNINSRSLLDNATSAIENCENTGNISNYQLYLNAVAEFERLEGIAINNFVSAVNEIGIVTENSLTSIYNAQDRQAILFGDTLDKELVTSTNQLFESKLGEFEHFESNSLPESLSRYYSTNITKDTKILGSIFTIRNTLTVESNTKSIPELTSGRAAHRIASNGSSFNSGSTRTLMFNAKTIGQIVIYAFANKTPAANLLLYKGNSLDLNADGYMPGYSELLPTSGYKKVTWDITEAGYYQIGASNGMDIYHVEFIPAAPELVEGELCYQTAGNAIRFIGLLLEEDYTESEIKFVINYEDKTANITIDTIYQAITVRTGEGIQETADATTLGANYLTALTLTDFSDKDYIFTIKLVINGEDCQEYEVTFIDGNFTVEKIV